MFRIAHFLLLATCIAVFACGGVTTDGDGGQEVRFLSMGTAPPGGAFFVVGGAIARVFNENTSGFSMTAEATSGSQENIRRLTSGELDFALSNSAITYFAVRGTEGWDKAYPMRAVMTLAPNVAMFVAAADSAVESIPDLAGRRVSVGPAGAGFEYFIRPLLAAHGVTYDDFSPVNATQAGAVDLLTDGAVVAAFLGGAVPTASITQAAAVLDIRLVAYGPEAMQQLITEYVFFNPATIPAATYRGIDTDYKGLDVGSMHLITSADVNEEIVYEAIKALYENREAVVSQHPAGRAINASNVVRDTGTEFHPGAVRFYREIGIWPQ